MSHGKDFRKSESTDPRTRARDCWVANLSALLTSPGMKHLQMFYASAYFLLFPEPEFASRLVLVLVSRMIRIRIGNAKESTSTKPGKELCLDSLKVTRSPCTSKLVSSLSSSRHCIRHKVVQCCTSTFEHLVVVSFTSPRNL